MKHAAETLTALKHAGACLKEAGKFPWDYDFWIKQANVHLAQANEAFVLSMCEAGAARGLEARPTMEGGAQ